MNRLWPIARRILPCWMVLTLAATAWAEKKEPVLPVLRWSEGLPGCTFSADDDGRYRYGLWTDDLGIVLAVDSQELQKSMLRTFPVFAALLTLHYRGQDSRSLKPENVSLEFVKHSHDVQTAIDPGDLATKFWNDGANFAAETEQEIQKHPEKRVEKEIVLQAHQKNVGEMLEFVKTRGLREIKLDPGRPEGDGWVFFSARSKWVGDWNKQEEFVLRISLPEKTVEFPFLLPPSRGDFLLRRRP
jgi:hypothetical protein